MKLNNRKTTSEPLALINLSEENKEEYLNVFNNSFSNMPHGCYYEMDDIEKYLNDNSENRYYYNKLDKFQGNLKNSHNNMKVAYKMLKAGFKRIK